MTYEHINSSDTYYNSQNIYLTYIVEQRSNIIFYLAAFAELGNQIEVLTVGEGEGSGEEDEESVPVCSVGRDASTDDVCADAAVAPMHARPKSDLSPTQGNEVCILKY